WVSGRLLALQRKRIAICATLVNRRIEAAKPVVDLACWFNGNGALRAIENRDPGLASESLTFEGWAARWPIGHLIHSTSVVGSRPHAFRSFGVRPRCVCSAIRTAVARKENRRSRDSLPPPAGSGDGVRLRCGCRQLPIYWLH